MAVQLMANAPRFTFFADGNELSVYEFKVRERISELFEGNVKLVSEQEYAFEDIIGKTALLTVEGPDGDRYFNGLVHRFMLIGTRGRFFLYDAHVVPQVHLLTLRRDCRIFQNQSVPDIVKKVLDDGGVTGDLFTFRLRGTYAARDYCVQYRESDWAFISRLLAPEAVYAKPVIEGVQTAIVTGPDEEEIYTDRHGRVKVQFHWDRAGKRNENSSCWIRVSQQWAGAGWGAMFIPRVGQEVIVDFIEGDPDRPIITGRVYHGTNTPPYALPAEKTKSTIKSNTYKKGNGSNEIRFEDKKGNEEIYLHGQKDWNIAINNNKSQTIGYNESLSVGNDRTKTVGKNQQITVGQHHTEMVGGNMSVGVAQNMSESIGLAKSLSIGGAYQATVGGVMNETVGGAKTEQVGAAKSVAVGAHSSEVVGGNKSLDVGKSM